MFKINSIGYASLIDVNSGEEICDLGKVVDASVNFQVSAEQNPPIEISVNNVNFNDDIMQALLGEDIIQPNYNIELKGSYVIGYEQVRKHKKKRINKKWAKKYGFNPVYKPTILVLDNYTLIKDEEDNDGYSISGYIRY